MIVRLVFFVMLQTYMLVSILCHARQLSLSLVRALANALLHCGQVNSASKERLDNGYSFRVFKQKGSATCVSQTLFLVYCLRRHTDNITRHENASRSIVNIYLYLFTTYITYIKINLNYIHSISLSL